MLILDKIQTIIIALSKKPCTVGIKYKRIFFSAHLRKITTAIKKNSAKSTIHHSYTINGTAEIKKINHVMLVTLRRRRKFY
jgi:hypothetical protein